jgi:hypothetical protein
MSYICKSGQVHCIDEGLIRLDGGHEEPLGAGVAVDEETMSRLELLATFEALVLPGRPLHALLQVLLSRGNAKHQQMNEGIK